jgi:hypothetical protein
MKKACVYFHQGWTDIIMCMGLINYYNEKYNEIYVLIRSDAKDIIDFYIKSLNGVHIVYMDTDNGRFYGQIISSNKDEVTYENGSILIPENFDLMFHGEHDRYRKDNYKGYWYQPENMKNPTNHFSEMFYVFYNIDFSNRISKFIFERDTKLEDKKLAEFIKEYGENYVLYHDDESNHQHGQYHISTKIDFENKHKDCKYININKQSKILFDYIKIFQKAKEIHLVDSVWACLFYQLDAKYNILQDKIITVYCKRGHQNLFQYPIKLDNWIIK